MKGRANEEGEGLSFAGLPTSLGKLSGFLKYGYA